MATDDPSAQLEQRARLLAHDIHRQRVVEETAANHILALIAAAQDQAKREALESLRPMSGFEKNWYTGGKTGDTYWVGVGKYEADKELDAKIDRRIAALTNPKEIGK